MTREVTIEIEARAASDIALQPAAEIEVVVQPTEIEIECTTAGEKGAKGETGNSSNLISKIAGENISGGKVVMIGNDGKVYVFDITNENNYGKVCGISKQAARP
jgi:hypothetical protein